jgi:shikimate kinase
MKIISSNGIIIYLEVSIIEAFKRLKYKRNRPVLFNNSDEFVSDDELLNRITKIYNKRLALYNKADLKINTDKMNVGKTVDLLRIILKKDFGIE